MGPEPAKKRKIDSPLIRRDVSLPHAKKEAGVAAYNRNVPHPHTGVDAHLRIQQAKNFAVAEAQQDGCKGNYKIFDSPFGNFMVPVVPTRADLAG